MCSETFYEKETPKARGVGPGREFPWRTDKNFERPGAIGERFIVGTFFQKLYQDSRALRR